MSARNRILSYIIIIHIHLCDMHLACPKVRHRTDNRYFYWMPILRTRVVFLLALLYVGSQNSNQLHVCSACVTATINFSLCHCFDVSLTAKSASECVYTCTLNFLFIVTLCAVHAFHHVHLTPTNAQRHDHRPITRNILNHNVVPTFPLNLSVFPIKLPDILKKSCSQRIMSDSTTHIIVPTVAPVPAATPALRQAPLAHVPVRTYFVEQIAPLALVVAMVVELLLFFLTAVFLPAVIAYIVAEARVA